MGVDLETVISLNRVYDLGIKENRMVVEGEKKQECRGFHSPKQTPVAAALNHRLSCFSMGIKFQLYRWKISRDPLHNIVQ